jgi:hypothetical protein
VRQGTVSTRKRVLIEDCAATTVHRLYAKLIRPKVLPYRTHLPQYTLEAAAGRFGRHMVVNPQGWVEVRTDLPLTDDMFVIHVHGHSMEPEIPDVCLCAFRSKIVDSREGKVLLIEHCNELGGGSHTVKVVRASKAVDPNERAIRLGCTSARLCNRPTLDISLGTFRLPKRSESRESSFLLSDR